MTNSTDKTDFKKRKKCIKANPVNILGKILCFFAIILFLSLDPVIGLLDAVFVKGLFDKFKPDPILDVTVVLVCISCFVSWIGNLKKDYVYSFLLIVPELLILALYVNYRFVIVPWEFYKFSPSWLNMVAYLDLLMLPLVFICATTTMQLVSKKTHNEKNGDLLNDAHIKYDGVDSKLFDNREVVLVNFSDLIVNVNKDVSFAIALLSPWGTGKTSFLDAIKFKIRERDKKGILMNFNPWFSDSNTNITAYFFNTLSECLGEYHSGLSRRFQNYLKLLNYNDKRNLFEILQTKLGLASNRKGIIGQYEHINNCIGSLNRNVYIFIDDLDRLSGHEIFECFKMIRNTANFKNVVFVVAFDRDYVVKQLEALTSDNNGLDAEKYLDKIFQLKYNLPGLLNDDLMGYLKQQLQDSINEEHIFLRLLEDIRESSSISNLNDQVAKITIKYHTSFYLKDIRSCNQVLNLYKTQLKQLGDDIVPEELFYISILKSKYPREALELYLNFDEYYEFRGYPKLKKGDKEEYKVQNLNESHEFFSLIVMIFFPHTVTHKSVCLWKNYFYYYSNAMPNYFIKETELTVACKALKNMSNAIASYKGDDDINLDKKSHLKDMLLFYEPRGKDQVTAVILGLIMLHEDSSKPMKRRVIQLLKTNETDNLDLLKEIVKEDISSYLGIISAIIMEIKQNLLKNYFPSEIGKQCMVKAKELHYLSLKLLEQQLDKSYVDDQIFDVYNACFDPNNKAKENFKMSDYEDCRIDRKAHEKVLEFLAEEKKLVSFLGRAINKQNNPKLKPGCEAVFSGIRKRYNEFNDLLEYLVGDYKLDDLKNRGHNSVFISFVTKYDPQKDKFTKSEVSRLRQKKRDWEEYKAENL